MKLPKIDPDDLVLFGSLALAALGIALIVGTTTGDVLAAAGAALLVFGIPSALVTFMAAGEEPK